MVSYSGRHDQSSRQIRAILRDEALYPDAETFNPERFLHDGQIRNDVPDPRFSFFGYGRRYA